MKHVNLFVNPVWDPTGERREWNRNIRDFTDEDEDLEQMLFLGAYLGADVEYRVLQIKYDFDFVKGYIGVKWFGMIEECGFNMHLSLAKWNVQDWRRSAVFSYHEGIPDMVPIYAAFERWKLQWCVPFLEICQIESSEVIGTKTYQGGWRTIIKTCNRPMTKKLYDAKCTLEDTLALGRFNRVNSLHFSLDTWFYYYPEWVTNGTFG